MNFQTLAAIIGIYVSVQTLEISRRRLEIEEERTDKSTRGDTNE